MKNLPLSSPRRCSRSDSVRALTSLLFACVTAACGPAGTAGTAPAPAGGASTSAAAAPSVEWFTDRAEASGIDFVHVNGATGKFYYPEILPPGVALFDYDNDGDLDIYVANGHVIDNVKLYEPTSSFAQKPLLYENVGAGRFRDVSAQSGPALQIARVGRGLAVADFNNDGVLDIAIANQGQAPLLLKGQGVPGANWITIRAKGHTSNDFGLGARVEIEAGGRKQIGEINNVASYLSSNDIRAHFGLGAAKTITRMTVRWPSGKVQTLTNVAANQILTVDEP